MSVRWWAGPLLALLIAGGCTADERADDATVVDDTGSEPGDLAPLVDMATAIDATRPPPPVDAGPPLPCECPTGQCVARENDLTELCANPCAGTSCPAGHTCLNFPPNRLCLPAGARTDGTWCNNGSDCLGGLCLYTGGRSRFCSRGCSGINDSSCGAGRSCLPAMTPRGAWHCLPTGNVETGGHCTEAKPHVCQGGYCLGQGHSTYCSHQCGPGLPACPTDWRCSQRDTGWLCELGLSH